MPGQVPPRTYVPTGWASSFVGFHWSPRPMIASTISRAFSTCRSLPLMITGRAAPAGRSWSIWITHCDLICRSLMMHPPDPIEHEHHSARMLSLGVADVNYMLNCKLHPGRCNSTAV